MKNICKPFVKLFWACAMFQAQNSALCTFTVCRIFVEQDFFLSFLNAIYITVVYSTRMNYLYTIQTLPIKLLHMHVLRVHTLLVSLRRKCHRLFQPPILRGAPVIKGWGRAQGMGNITRIIKKKSSKKNRVKLWSWKIRIGVACMSESMNSIINAQNYKKLRRMNQTPYDLIGLHLIKCSVHLDMQNWFTLWWKATAGIGWVVSGVGDLRFRRLCATTHLSYNTECSIIPEIVNLASTLPQRTVGSVMSSFSPECCQASCKRKVTLSTILASGSRNEYCDNRTAKFAGRWQRNRNALLKKKQ